MLIGWKVSEVGEKSIIPSCVAVIPEMIGSHDPDITCHSTGTETSPNVTAHLAIP